MLTCSKVAGKKSAAFSNRKWIIVDQSVVLFSPMLLPIKGKQRKSGNPVTDERMPRVGKLFRVNSAYPMNGHILQWNVL